jgi:hypothetical protein
VSSFSLPIQKDGAIVRIRVGFAQSTEITIRQAGRAVRPALDIAAMIDTGADVSMVDYGLLTPFVRENMPLVAFVNVNAPGLGGLSLRPQFLTGVRVCHPSGNVRDDLILPATELVEHTLGAPSYQVLIGRDILSLCVFTFDGPANTFTLTY